MRRPCPTRSCCATEKEIGPNDTKTVNNELGRIGKEAIMAGFKVLSGICQSPGRDFNSGHLSNDVGM
jgi:hypothetical protein